MKQQCYIVRDLMANYIEGLVSEQSAADIGEHLAECPDCSKTYRNMTAEIDPPTDNTPRYSADSAAKDNVAQVGYLKKFNYIAKALIIIACAAVGLAVLTAAVSAFLVISWVGCGGDRDITTDIARYEECLGADGKYKDNYLGRNDIFPDSLPDSAKTEKFYCECYNPWDANYLSYLVYTCGDGDFRRECERLDSIKSSDPAGVYGIRSFPYTLRAVYADEYHGVIYALSDDDNNRLIYVGLEFCNYFTDIDYRSVIAEEYLPEGFDASEGNPARQSFEHGTTASVPAK